jgi:putative transposase
MPAKRPPYLRGKIYHLYNRGAHRLSLFREEDNYLSVLRKIKTYCRALALAPIAYCLMPNHYHLLTRQDGDHRAGLLPQRVFNSYTKAYNKRYGHSGTLFEGHYRVKLVENDRHLLHLCRYIHANPVKDGLVEAPADWPYSNYLEWTEAWPGTLVDRDFVRAHFPSPGDYAEFVEDYLHHRKSAVALESYMDDW